MGTASNIDSPRGFAYALTGVWPQGEADNAIWARIERARADAIMSGLDAGGPLPAK